MPTTTTQKPPTKDPKNEKDLEPVRANKWRNLYFRKDGRSGFGKLIFDQIAEAQYAANAVREYLTDAYMNGIRLQLPDGIELNSKNFSHHMQIPWSKNE